MTHNPAQPSDRAYALHLGWALFVVALSSTACGGAPTLDMQWASQRSLPPSDAVLAPLWECEAPGDSALCPAPPGLEWSTTAVRCESLTRDPRTAFTGHRCLAHIALEEARRFVVVKTGGASASGDAAPEDPRTDHATADGHSAEKEAFSKAREEHTRERLQEALGHLDQLVSISPEDPALYAHRLAVLVRLGDIPAAARDVAAAAALTQDEDLLWSLHGVGYELASRDVLEGAIAIFAALIEGRPTYGPALVDLGALYMIS